MTGSRDASSAANLVTPAMAREQCWKDAWCPVAKKQESIVLHIDQIGDDIWPANPRYDITLALLYKEPRDIMAPRNYKLRILGSELITAIRNGWKHFRFTKKKTCWHGEAIPDPNVKIFSPEENGLIL